MILKDLPPKLIEMLLAIRAQLLIWKKHDKNGRGTGTGGRDERDIVQR